MENAKELLKKRQKMIDDVVGFVPQKTTPILENLFKWKFLDTEMDPKPTPWDFLTNMDLMEKVVREHQERYDPDLSCDWGTRNNMLITVALDHSQQHTVTNKEEGIIQTLDVDVFGEPEAMLEYADDPVRYAWTKGIPKLYPEGLTFGQIQDACSALKTFNDYRVRINRIMNEEYGSPSTAISLSVAPLENVAMYFRGLKNFSLDMRRKPELFDEFNEKMAPGFLANVENGCQQERGNYAFSDWTVLLVHNLMNNKQFERFLWRPYYGPLYEILAKNGRTSLTFIEGYALRLADCYNEVPRGVICCYFEQDDPFEMRKAMPNIAFAYYPQPYLAYRTPEEAVDKAKELVEGMGPGYMYCTNKMLESREDQKRENVLAVYEYLRNH